MQRLIETVSAWFLPPKAAKNGPYKVFTHDFDRTVRGVELNGVLGFLDGKAKSAWLDACQELDKALLGWQTRDAIIALEASERVRAKVSAEALAGTAVCLLVDQSGSMRGQSMLLAAAATNTAQDYLHHLGCKAEILGFTTVGWKGGKSRARWRFRGKPARPGRLCDLLHIIYQTYDDPGVGAGTYKLHPMLRPDLPKENVDGEALEWAADRLNRRPEGRKILVVLSDGASVDDSTLLENGPAFLEDHLKQVIKSLEVDPTIQLGAIGIGFDVSRYYLNSKTVKTPNEIGSALLSLFEEKLLSNSTQEQGDKKTVEA